MFLFQGFYSIAWTPLLYLYPPEVMNYSIRANGLAFSQLMLNALAWVATLCISRLPLLTTPSLIFVFIMPIGLANIGWKMYMVNASWDIVIVVLIVSWTKPLSIYSLCSQISRLSSGLRQKARLWKRSMQSLRARNIPPFPTSKRSAAGRRL